MTRARFALVLAVVACAGCGLVNGLTEGDVRSPFAGEGEGEGEGEQGGCADDEPVCWSDDELCDTDLSPPACADPDSLTGWCEAALQLLDREDNGPLVELGGGVTLVDGCFVARLIVHDLESDVSTSTAVLLVQYVVPGSPALFANVTDITEDDDGDDAILSLLVDVEACVATTDDTAIALNVTDEGDNRSNAACGDIPAG